MKLEALTPTTPDLIRAAGCRPVVRALLAHGAKIRHDPAKLGRALVELGRLPDATGVQGESAWITPPL